MTRSAQALVLGLLLALVGYVLFVVAATAGSGVLVAQVGIIAIGVRLGLQDHRAKLDE